MTAMTLTGIAGPPLTGDSRSNDFYIAAGRGDLLARRCVECGHVLVPEARTCTSCTGQKLEWTRLAGRGKLVSWAVVHQAPLPAFGEQVPFTVGIVEVAEGPWLQLRIVHRDVALKVGMPLAVAFVRPDEGEAYPVFVPA